MIQPSRWSLVRQLSAGVFVLIVLVLSLLLFLSSFQTRNMMIAQLEDDQQRLVGALAAQLTGTHANIIHGSERLASTFAELYPDELKIDPQQTVLVGNYNAPLVTHQGEAVNLNFEQVDRFARMTGGNATVFIRYGDDFLRVTTSLKNERGQRAIGTLLGMSHPGYRELINGDTYVGEAHLFGTDYMTQYTPVTDVSGRVIAILYVGLPISDVMSDLRDSLLDLRVGDSGYLGLIDLEDKRIPGKLLVHSRAQDKGFESVYGDSLQGYAAEVLSAKSGASTFIESGTGREASLHFERSGSDQWVVYSVSYLEEFVEPINRLLWTMAIMSMVAVAVLVSLLAALFKLELKPVAVMRDVLYRIGQGDLTHRFDGGTQDSRNELHQLQGSIDEMLEQFSEVIGQVRHAGDEIASSSDSVAELSGIMQTLSRNSNEETAQVSVAIRQMAESVEEVSASAAAVAQDAGSTAELSDSGNQVMTDVVQQVDSLQHQFQEAVSAVEQLRTDSDAIGKVVEVISSVAEQTNLLALNAAIEAARAGEQGRGFAVVADEVRTLAQRTQESTQEIQQVVVALQDNAVNASRRMEDGVGQIRQCVEQVEHAGSLLTQIREAAEQVSSHMESVASATEEQSAVATQISGSSEALRHSAQETASGAEENAAVGKRMASQADALRGQVGRFKV